MSQNYTITIQPGINEWEEPINRYIKRTNYGPSMTCYTIDNKISALLIKERLENEGYTIHLEEPDGNTLSTAHTKIHAGINIG